MAAYDPLANVSVVVSSLSAKEMLGVVLKANPAKRHLPLGVTGKVRGRQAERDRSVTRRGVFHESNIEGFILAYEFSSQGLNLTMDVAPEPRKRLISLAHPHNCTSNEVLDVLNRGILLVSISEKLGCPTSAKLPMA